MFSITPMSSASEWYYLSLIAYYLGRRWRKRRRRRRRNREDDAPDDDLDPGDAPFSDASPYTIDTPGEPPGIWFGQGAEDLELLERIYEEAYHRVFRGYHPITGEPLVQNAGKPDRRAGWDTCFSAVKDLSVLISQAEPQLREELQGINMDAAKETLRLIERRFAFSRAGKAAEGCTWVPVGLVMSLFEHMSSRATANHPPDPNLHIHAQIHNLGVDAEGKVRAIEPKFLFRNQKILTAYYRAALAHRLWTQLGLTTYVSPEGFRILGVPRTLVDLYSKRRKVILDYMEERGLAGGKAAAMAALATRQRKGPVLSWAELFEEWRKTNEAARFTDADVAQFLRHGPKQPSSTVPKVIRRAMRELLRNKNHFGRNDLILRTLSLLPDYGLSPESIFEEVDRFLEEDPEVTHLGFHDGDSRFTTRRVLQEERRMLRALERLAARPGNTVSERKVGRELKKNLSLSEEQAQFVRHLTETKAAIRIGLGWAGTGKTSRGLRTCVRIWKRQGYRVIAVAPTGQAARVLGEEIGVPCQTLTKFLGDYRLSMSIAMRHHVRQFWRAARRRRTWRFRQPRPVPITPDTIVLVDEAGMIGTRYLRKLAEQVQRGGGTLCLIGDPSQLPAVESTSPLHSLMRRYPAATLTDIRRQRQEWARKAARCFAEGDPASALTLFAEHNRITVREDVDAVVRQACLDWTEEGLLSPHRAIILANTNALTHAANQCCQEHRLRAGVLNPARFLRVRDEQEDAVFESRVHLQDRVLFTRNSHGPDGYGVDNGSLGTVIAFSPFNSQMLVALDDGRQVRVNVADFPHVRLGYSVSTYRSQGASIAKVFAIVGDSLQSLPASYVQATRGVEDTQLYTTTKFLNASLEDVGDSPLARQMARRPDPRLAADLLESAPLDFRKRKVQIKTPRVGRRRRRADRQRLLEREAEPPSMEPPEAEEVVEEPPEVVVAEYQRLRLPAGQRLVSRGTILQASCVDGGSEVHRDRPPPPPGCPMPYAMDSIRVQRREPVPSPEYTLHEATRAGLVRLIGTGSQDHVEVHCSPGEQWVVTVGDSLGLISAQDDILQAAAVYAQPRILEQLERLDALQRELCLVLPHSCLLLSLFSCARREISWKLPSAADPVAVTRDVLGRFCRLLFEDIGAREHFHWFQHHHTPAWEAAVGLSLNEAADAMQFRPPPEVLNDLGRAMARQQSIDNHYNACVASIVSQFPIPPTDQALGEAMAPLEERIARVRDSFRSRAWNPFDELIAMQTLYRAAEQTLPAGVVFQSVFKLPFHLMLPRMEQFYPALRMWQYATAFVRGEEDIVRRMAEQLQEALANPPDA